MKKLMKRSISLLLALVLMVQVLPMEAFAAEDKFLEVVVENAPVRKKPSAEGKIVKRCEEGALLRKVGSCINKKLNLWYEVKFPGENKTYYIFSDNVKAHEHSYEDLTINEVTYHVCICGNITADAKTEDGWAEANIVLSSTAAALPYADGPLPYGDVAAACIVLVTTCLAMQMAVPGTELLADLSSDWKFDDYLKDREENTCSNRDFRRVGKFKGGLYYIDDKCLNMVEAYLYVCAFEEDVYTRDETTALLLADMHSSFVRERDKPGPKKDISTYFYHYHLGTDRKIGAHVFFGLNDRGEGPKERKPG